MRRNPKKGIVHLVGAGPGDPKLLTLAGEAFLKSADVIIYDQLVNPSLLDLAPRAEKICAAKIRSCPSPYPNVVSLTPTLSQGERERVRGSGRGKGEGKSQDAINRLLVQKASEGKNVVRLKGGDPFVFGRGGEEALFLKKHQIPFSIVPGVSAGHSVPAYAGIPVTDRTFASQVIFVTANEDPDKNMKSVEWEKLADFTGTLVLFMGIRTLKQVSRRLIKAGRAASTLTTVIEHGTLPEQRVVEGNLGNIADLVQKKKIHSPAITVIGEVNRYRKDLVWYERPILNARTIIVTRASNQNSSLKGRLKAFGANVVEFPTIQIKPPSDWRPVDQALERMSSFDWILFTSTNGAEFFFRRLQERGDDTRMLAGVKVAAIGEATAQLLKQYGISADLVPDDFTTEALIESLKAKEQISGRHFLLPRTNIAPEYLKSELERLGARITQIEMYRTEIPKRVWSLKEISVLISNPQTWITFTSSSTVRNFFEALPKSLRAKLRCKMISIGPVTSQTIKEYGLKPFREASEHTIEGLVRVIIEK